MRKRNHTPVLRRRYDFSGRSIPLGAWILLLILGASFVEVWQATRASQLTISTDATSRKLQDAVALRDDLDAKLAATRTRTALESRARDLDMRPAEPNQIVIVPAAFLAGGSEQEEGGRALVAFGRRIAETLVPSARARSRTPLLQ